MRKILKIISKTQKVSAKGKKYWQTVALLEDGEEYFGFGREFAPGELVECWYDQKYQRPKMQKP